MNIDNLFHKYQDNFSGRVITKEDANLLKSKFSKLSFINELVNVFEGYPLVESYCDLEEEYDNSGLGVEMQWLTPSEIIEEAFECYPGISAIQLGFLPIGKCLEGSGDPYFLAYKKEEYRIYRIPHDAIEDEQLIIKEVEYICPLVFLLENTK